MNIIDTLGLSLPIFQAPISCYPNQAKLVAAVSQHGGLGILCANYQSLLEVDESIGKIQAKTAKAFAVMINVNIGDSSADLVDKSQANRYLTDAYHHLNVDKTETVELPSIDKLLQLVINKRPPVIIFQNGLPADHLIHQCQKNDITVMAIAGNALEAIVASRVVDAIILQGCESAGVQSRFANQLAIPSYPVSTLLQQALPNVNKPLIVWGDAQLPQHIASHLINGAAAVMIDTPFWTTKESPIPPSYRQALITQHNEMQTTLSSVWLGYPARTLINTLTKATAKYTTTLPPKTQQHIMLPIIQAAIEQDNPDYMPMWAGFCAVTSGKTVAQLCKAFAKGLNEIITD
ncbi:MAG: hypothetical protein CR975_04475 [Gammaproteobacteria bacterium]|nr:MAG: hypothetical protein CR975_04475 [Gammaproteobacteria bacterium]